LADTFFTCLPAERSLEIGRQSKRYVLLRYLSCHKCKQL
jgi:hypothetical protein